MGAKPPAYQAFIVPALNRIQDQFGYLKREALQQFAAESDLPLYRIQAVASFFPHFRMTPPKKVTLRVCRDMACHMAGSADILKKLSPLNGEAVLVEGASCLGRCDRAPAACVEVHQAQQLNSQKNGHENGHGPAAHSRELFVHGHSASGLKKMVEHCLSGQSIPMTPDVKRADGDNREHYPRPDWMIDPYPDGQREYLAIKKAVVARRASLLKAGESLQAQLGWTADRADQFRAAADRRLIVDFPLDKELLDAVRDWQTESNWAKGPELGGWAEAILNELDKKQADLRGLGGGGLPATQKWRDVRDAVREARRRREDDRAFIVVNGDESEPGTFKDRELLLHYPHLVIEGVLLAGIVTEATQGFIYIRHEYPEQVAACREEITRAFAEDGPLGVTAAELFPVSVFVSPGGYICGEQSALIEAMSDRRAEPRNMPPKLETNGLIDQPTLVSNVETFAWAPFIWMKGGQHYASLGTNSWRGRRFFSISGDVVRPGVYEVPMGMTLRELVYGENYCQGIVGGKKLKAFAPSGPSGGFLPAKLTVAAGLPKNLAKNETWKGLASRRGFDPSATELDLLDMELELDAFRALSPTQALGAGLVVYAEGRDMMEQALNSMQFYRNETCGKCVPCRIGSQKLVSLGTNLVNKRISQSQWTEQLFPLVKDLSDAMTLASICGLGRSVPVPLKTVIDLFPEDLAAHFAAEPVAAELAGATR